MAHDGLALLLGNRVGDELAVALEGGDDVQLLAVQMAGANRSPVDHQAGPVESAHGDQASRHVLVATRDGDVGVIPLRAHDGFNRVGDQVAGLQRIAHAIGAHRDAIADPDGVEAQTHHAGGVHTFLHLFGQPQKMHVAGIALVPNAGNAHLRLGHVLFGQAGRVEHGLRSALRFRLCNLGTVLVQRSGRFTHKDQCIVCFLTVERS